MTTSDDSYPSNWPGARTQAAAPAAPIEAVMLALDSFVASLSVEEFDALVARTRGGL
jgi:hypothetical protein